jgi:hypothetical protein
MATVSEHGVVTVLRRLCMQRICMCRRGTHAWEAIQPSDEHMLPHDPESKLRAERFIKEGWEEVRAIRRVMGRDELTGEPWRRVQ